MKKRFFQNWLLKLASVLCAVVLWIIIYSVDDPAASTTIYNVPVTFLNTEVVTDQNQVYEVLDNSDVVRRISIHSTRSVIDRINDSDIRVEADFSKMKLDGTIELKFYSDRHNDSIDFKPSASELKISVEDRKEKNVSLSLVLTGTPEEGYIIGSSKLAQNRITINGAESIINLIDRAVATVDVENVSDDIFAYADITLLDKEGQEISKDKINMSTKLVNATVEIFDTKTVPIIYTANGEAAEGFFATGEIYPELNEVLIAGKENTISRVSEIVVAGEDMSIAGAQTDVVTRVDLDDYLPSGIVRADKEWNGHISVTMPVVPIVEKEYTFPMGQMIIANVPEGYDIVHIYAEAQMTAKIRGPQHLLDALAAEQITGIVDISQWMEVNEIESFEDAELLSIVGSFIMPEHIEVLESGAVELIVKQIEE